MAACNHLGEDYLHMQHRVMAGSVSLPPYYNKLV